METVATHLKQEQMVKEKRTWPLFLEEVSSYILLTAHLHEHHRIKAACVRPQYIVLTHG